MEDRLETLSNFSDLLKFSKKSLDNDDMSIPESISIYEGGPTEPEIELQNKDNQEFTFNRQFFECDINSNPDVCTLFRTEDNFSDVNDLALPVDVNSCLALNLTYQELINEEIINVEQMLQENREKQETLSREIEHQTNLFERKNLVGNILSLKVFITPYFKDSSGMPAPQNVDALRMKNYFHLDPNLCTPRYWCHKDIQKLTHAVKENIFNQFRDGLLDRKTELLDRLQTPNDNTEERNQYFNQELKRVQDRLQNAVCYQALNKDEINKINIDWLRISITEFKSSRDSENCRLMWKNRLKPGINRSKWKSDEDKTLLDIIKMNPNITWEIISQILNTQRTAYQCMERYCSKLMSPYRNGPWTNAEDKCLLQTIEMCSIGKYIPWNQVHYYVGTRPKNRLITRYVRCLNPEYNHGKWTDAEDLQLLTAMKMYGTKWKVISSFLKSRNSQQCRNRFVRSIDPALKCGSWTVEEDDKLIKLVQENGDKNWRALRPYFPQRKNHQIRQRYMSILNHRTKLAQDAVSDGSQLDLPLSKAVLWRKERTSRIIKIINNNFNEVKELNQKKLTHDQVFEYFNKKSVSQDDYESLLLKFKDMHHNKSERKICGRRKMSSKEEAIVARLDDYIFPTACHRFTKKAKNPGINIDEHLKSCTKEMLAQNRGYSKLPLFPSNEANLRGFKSLLMEESKLASQMKLCSSSNKEIVNLIMGEESNKNSTCSEGTSAESETSLKNPERLSKLKEEFDLLESKFQSLFMLPAAFSAIFPPSPPEVPQPQEAEKLKVKKKYYRPKKFKKPWVFQRHKQKRDDKESIENRDSKIPEKKEPSKPMKTKTKRVFNTEPRVTRSSKRVKL